MTTTTTTTTNPPTNHAAWLNAPNTPLRVSPAPLPTPLAPNEVLLRIHATALNPADAYMQVHGLLITSYPTVLGFDCAGTIIQTGSGIPTSTLQPGDRVLAASAPSVFDEPGAPQRDNPGTFQLYAAVKADMAVKIPSTISFKDASVLPICTGTAAIALFSPSKLALSLPQPTRPQPSSAAANDTSPAILIWGGSSSVGSCAIQLAKAAGYAVATTCSAHNLSYCRETLGADYVFEHQSASVVEDIAAALEGREFAGALDCVMPAETVIKSGKIVGKLGEGGGVKKLVTIFASAQQMEAMAPGAAGEVPGDVEVLCCKSFFVSASFKPPAFFLPFFPPF